MPEPLSERVYRPVFITPVKHMLPHLLYCYDALILGTLMIIFLCKGGNSPAIVAMLFIGMAVAVGLVLLHLRLDIRRRIVLFNDHVWIGGLLCEASIPDSLINAVKVNTEGKSSHELIICWDGNSFTSVKLTTNDAAECLQALQILIEESRSTS